MTYQSQFERLELKYLVDEATAARLRGDIAAYTEPDRYNAGHGRGYRITSLYFDSPSLAFYRAKERGDTDRLKLRARVYDLDGPVSLEIKRKRGDVVWKRRAQVDPGAWHDAAQGFFDEGKYGDRQRQALENFAQLYAQFACEPKLLVSYEREAFSSPVDHYARVTFDRRVQCHSAATMAFRPENSAGFPLPNRTTGALASPVLLELKCEQFMPVWMWELIHDHQLMRVGFSKYNAGMRAVLNEAFVRDDMLREVLHA